MSKSTTVVAIWVGDRTDKRIIVEAVEKIDGKLVDLSGLKSEEVVKAAVAAGANRIITSNPRVLVPMEFQPRSDSVWGDGGSRKYLQDMGMWLVEDISHTYCTCHYDWNGLPAAGLPLCCNDVKWVVPALVMSLQAEPPAAEVLLTDEQVRAYAQRQLEERMAALPAEYEEYARKRIERFNKIRAARAQVGLE